MRIHNKIIVRVNTTLQTTRPPDRLLCFADQLLCRPPYFADQPTTLQTNLAQLFSTVVIIYIYYIYIYVSFCEIEAPHISIDISISKAFNTQVHGEMGNRLVASELLFLLQLRCNQPNTAESPGSVISISKAPRVPKFGTQVHDEMGNRLLYTFIMHKWNKI